MDPTLVVILISAIVLVFPVIKSLWNKLNGESTPVQVFAPIAPGAAVAPAVQTTVKSSAPAGCLGKLIEFAACLPENDRKELIERFAATLVLKEIQ